VPLWERLGRFGELSTSGERIPARFMMNVWVASRVQKGNYWGNNMQAGSTFCVFYDVQRPSNEILDEFSDDDDMADDADIEEYNRAWASQSSSELLTSALPVLVGAPRHITTAFPRPRWATYMRFPIELMPGHTAGQPAPSIQCSWDTVRHMYPNDVIPDEFYSGV